MSIPTPITPVVLDTVLGHLAHHFLASANGDVAIARHAASRMLAAYDIGSEQELHLVTDIVSFGFNALAALSRSAEPDLPLNKTLRLRGSAVSLSREAHKARRQLAELQRSRHAAALQPETTVPEPADEPQPSPQDALPSLTAAAQPVKSNPNNAWIMNRQQRQAQQITENLRRNRLEQERRLAAAAPVPPPPATPAHA